MTAPTPTPSGSHKAAAIALVLVSLFVATAIYNGFKASPDELRQCIAAGGGSTRCGMSSFAAGIMGLVIFLGFGAAAKVWKGK